MQIIDLLPYPFVCFWQTGVHGETVFQVIFVRLLNVKKKKKIIHMFSKPQQVLFQALMTIKRNDFLSRF